MKSHSTLSNAFWKSIKIINPGIFRQVQNAGHRSQVTGHRSQVTENAIKKLDILLGFLCLFICFISGYVTIRHMYDIDHASRCSKSKRTKYPTLYWNLKSSSSRSDSWRPRNDALIFAPREGTWIEVLRGECFANYRQYSNASCWFRFVGTYTVRL